MNVLKGSINQHDLIADVLDRGDYQDSYTIVVHPTTSIHLKECILPIFEKPAWMDLLYKIRDVLVKPFGLTTVKDEIIDLDAPIGGNLAFFIVLNRTEREILVYGDDKHLEAWFSVILEQHGQSYLVKYSTVVHFHNQLGRVYFALIRPFHYLILHYTLKKIQTTFARNNAL